MVVSVRRGGHIILPNTAFKIDRLTMSYGDLWENVAERQTTQTGSFPSSVDDIASVSIYDLANVRSTATGPYIYRLKAV